jgi:hypothetical protein
MAYITTVKCEQCEREALVPGPGAVPVTWIVAKSQQNGEEVAPTTYTWCGWACAGIYAQIQQAQQASNGGSPVASQIHVPQGAFNRGPDVR